MNGEERQLITSLFDRMRNVGAVEKDPDAETLINQGVRQIPDSAYLLVQSVLVQENALQQAGSRIEELEDRVRQLEDEMARRPAAQQSSGGFLGGLFGGGAPAAATTRGSVPPIGGGRAGNGRGAPASGGSAWGNAPGLNGSQPAQQAWGRQPQQGFGAAQQAAPAAGGGFMRSAMTTAAGVAGGMLVAGAISNMMKGDTAHAAENQNASDGGAGQAADGAQNAGYSDADNDPGTMDVADDGNDPGWGGDDGGDMDI